MGSGSIWFSPSHQVYYWDSSQSVLKPGLSCLGCRTLHFSSLYFRSFLLKVGPVLKFTRFPLNWISAAQFFPDFPSFIISLKFPEDMFCLIILLRSSKHCSNVHGTKGKGWTEDFIFWGSYARKTHSTMFSQIFFPLCTQAVSHLLSFLTDRTVWASHSNI